MSPTETIRHLLATATAAPLDEPLLNERTLARLAWSREMMATWRKAQREMDERCTEAVGRLDEEAFNRLFEAEEAKVTAIMAQIRAAADEDKWPWELYFGGV